MWYPILQSWSDYIIIRNGINVMFTVKQTTMKELTVILVVLNLKFMMNTVIYIVCGFISEFISVITDNRYELNAAR